MSNPYADYYKVGYILRTHGLKGEVTVALETDAPLGWHRLKGVFIDMNGQLIPHRVERLSVKGTRAFVKFTDISAQEKAAVLVQKCLYLPKSQRPKRTGLDFYDDELPGFTVYEKQAGMLGKVLRVDRTGHTRHLIISYKNEEKMIPVNGPFITGINRHTQTIAVELPEGFLDF